MSVKSFAKESTGPRLDESFNLGTHALVIGGSLGGLLTARVLADHFDHVTVIERDRLPQSAELRPGVPQASHVHGLMLRGRIILEKLFPGLQDEMMAGGAPLLDMAKEIAWLTPAGWGTRFSSDLRVLAFSRPFLDLHVRRRVASLPGVQIFDGTSTTSLHPNKNRDGVAGAFVLRRFPGVESEEMFVPADLVVDATGRGSRASRWLEDLGYPTPREEVVNSFRGYVSRYYHKPRDLDVDWKCLIIQASPPLGTRGGFILPVEGDRWLVTLIGAVRDYPPTDEAGFLEFARSLPSRAVYDAIRDAEPISSPSSYRATENRLRRFEGLARMPENFVVMGDAACAFNPVYGQGMTIAAMGAVALGETLKEQRRRESERSFKGFAQRFSRRLARINASPWLLATSEDFRFRETEGGPPSRVTRFMHRYMDRVLRLATTDSNVRQTLLEVFNMLKRPTALFRPGILFKVLTQSVFGSRPTRAAPVRRRQRQAALYDVQEP